LHNSKRKANRILKEYGKRMFEAHSDYFKVEQNHSSFTPVHARCSRRTAKRALVLCAVLILVFAVAVAVCSALGVNLFNFRFDYRDGYIVITGNEEDSGQCFYTPEYVVPGYTLNDVVTLGDNNRFYEFTSEDGKSSYIIEEGISNNTIRYVDNEGYDESTVLYGDYELKVFQEQSGPNIIVYLEKNGTYISIHGDLSLDQVYSIIDNLRVIKSESY